MLTKNVDVVIAIPEEIKFQVKEGYSILIKDIIHQEYVIIIKPLACNNVFGNISDTDRTIKRK